MELLTVMIILALLATVGALGAGVASMMRGGEYDRQHSTQLMFARVGFQGVALVLLLVVLFIATLPRPDSSVVVERVVVPGQTNQLY